MTTYTVTVRNDDTGDEIYAVNIPELELREDDDDVVTYAEQNDGTILSEGERVLLWAAPEVCPWDCDHCRA